jgi:hypothetical protein
MKIVSFAAIALLSSTVATIACPSWQQPGVQNYQTDGADLWSPNSYGVTAGGNIQLGNCPMPGSGYVISQPDFEFSLSGMSAYGRLNMRVNAGCDTVLLVNDPNGQWHFNDDASGLNPALNLASLDGVYDVWVGTYGSGNCSATLTLETF